MGRPREFVLFGMVEPMAVAIGALAAGLVRNVMMSALVDSSVVLLAVRTFEVGRSGWSQDRSLSLLAPPLFFGWLRREVGHLPRHELQLHSNFVQHLAVLHHSPEELHLFGRQLLPPLHCFVDR